MSAQMSNDSFQGFANSGSNARSFYKIVLPGTSTRGPEIPALIIEHVGGGDLDFASLSVSSRPGRWRVQLTKEEDSVVFKDGWDRFYRDNSLKVSDLLIFTYCGNLQFNVTVFDRNGSKIN